jgi:pimeloyl-ACP methyl ester carboxylesterase
VPLPADLTGTLNGADYKIRVPANWNGTLLVFAHGVQNAGIAPELAPATWPPVTPSLEDQLLEAGYALAGSGFQNFDKDGVLQTLALTEYFKKNVGHPKRIIIWGISLGAEITLKLIEGYPWVYDGAVANCAPDAGTPENMDQALAFGLAYSAALGWHDDVWGPVEDLRDGLNFKADVLPLMISDGSFPPGVATMGRWEFIRLVMHLPQEAFWLNDPLNAAPFFVLQMWKATERRAAVEAENGGPVAKNTDTQYSLTAEEKTYLAGLGVNADELLAFMNGTKVRADFWARLRAAYWGGFIGWLWRPVLTMHAKFDGLVFVSNESYYAQLVRTSHSSKRLVQSYVNTVGHCSFTADQYLSGMAAMNSWLETGVRPDASLLPPSQGFDLEYVPSPWVF